MYGVKVLELDKSWMEFIRKIFIIRLEKNLTIFILSCLYLFLFFRVTVFIFI